MAQQRARSQYFPGGYDYDASDDEEDYGGGFILTPRERANLEAKRRQDVIEKRRREQQEVRSRLIEEERKRRAKQEEFYQHLRDESVSCDTFNWPWNEGTNCFCAHQPRPEVDPVPSTSSNTSPSTHQSTPIDIRPRSQTPSHTSRSPSPSQSTQTPTTPISAETTTAAPSSLGQDEAAIKIQSLYRARRSMRTIKALESQFDTLKAAFILPSTIDFQDPEGGVVSVSLSSPSSTSSSNDTAGQGQPRAKLAYTATNVSLHTYVESLNRLLVALDGVESWGVKDVRESRKGVVRKVEKEAEEVDELWRRVWETYMKELKEEKKDVDVELAKSSVNSGADEEQLQGEREEQEVVAMVVDKVERGDESNVESHTESTLGNGLEAPDDEPAPVPESDCLDTSNPKQENNSISTSSTTLPSVQESAAPSSSLSADPSVSSPSAANIDIVDSPLISNLSDSDSVSDYGLELLTPLEKPDPLIFIVDSSSGDIGVGSEEGKGDDVDVASLGAEKQNADLEEDFVML